MQNRSANADLSDASAKHFEVMDGLRGIAAMAVGCFHCFGNYGPVTNGALAVDMFFILSGFVIAYSYDHRLRANMTALDFIAKRFIRLYPMILVGALGGIVVALVHNKTNPVAAYPLGSIAASGGLSLALLPYLGNEISEELFSFNPPLWSLFFEAVANLAYVLFARRLSQALLMVIVLLGLAGVVIGGMPGGNVKPTILLGFPRVACGFFGGVLLCRLWRADQLPKINGNFFACAAIICAVFLTPVPIEGWLFLPAYLVFAMVIACAAGAAPSRADKSCAVLGEVSYPLYTIHWLTLYVFTWLGAKVGLAGSRYVIVGALHMACAPVIAYLICRYYETPARHLLSRWWARSSVIKSTSDKVKASSKI
jgi:peptidoglycan/LPS O-acetylase OafA/YrhL